MTELEALAEKINKSHHAEDLFGTLTGTKVDQERMLKNAYQDMAKRVRGREGPPVP
jgi:hypothetical protein